MVEFLTGLRWCFCLPRLYNEYMFYYPQVFDQFVLSPGARNVVIIEEMDILTEENGWHTDNSLPSKLQPIRASRAY